MAATLGFYNPQFYAAEALQILMKALGFANTVYHGYEGERRAFGKGDIINIKKPGTFTVQDAPATAQDVVTESISITLDKWKEVKFKLTDKELALSSEIIIRDHISPAAYAIADYIDTNAITDLIPKLALNYSATAATRLAAITTTTTLANMTTVRQKMFEGLVPMRDPNQLFCMVDPATEAIFLQNTSFNQQSGAGAAGVATQVSGTLGPKFGINWYTNQNTYSYTSLAGTQLSSDTLTTSGTQARGAASIEATTSRSGATLIAGAILKMGNYHYRVSTAVTASTTNFTGANNIDIDEVVHEEVLTSVVITVVWNGEAAAVKAIPFYHRNSMAFVSAPLSELGNELGARIFAVQDPVTGIALRARLYYLGDSSTVHVALDVLYGYKVINNHLGGTIKAT